MKRLDLIQLDTFLQVEKCRADEEAGLHISAKDRHAEESKAAAKRAKFMDHAARRVRGLKEFLAGAPSGLVINLYAEIEAGEMPAPLAEPDPQDEAQSTAEPAADVPQIAEEPLISEPEPDSPEPEPAPQEVAKAPQQPESVALSPMESDLLALIQKAYENNRRTPALFQTEGLAKKFGKKDWLPVDIAITNLAEMGLVKRVGGAPKGHVLLRPLGGAA